MPIQRLSNKRLCGALFSLSSGILFSVIAGASQAMTSLDDSDLSGISGAGLALALDDFRFAMAPTSYIELTGTAGSAGWQRGDARYYGLSLTGGGAGTDWYGDGCSGADPLSCPMGTGSIANFASVYNPYVIRVFDYEGYDYQGALLSGNDRPTVLELIGPSSVPSPWRWAFWGEIEVGRSATAPAADGSNHSQADFLQSQTIIYGKPVTTDGKPAILRLLKTENNADSTFGIVYQSALSGDFRFSVGQLGNSPDALHLVPNFNDNEGLYFKNVDAYLPLGQLHYQAITLDDVAGAPGNFIIELTRIPNIPNVYNEFYSLGGDGLNDDPNIGYNRNNRPAEYFNTHGYARWGVQNSGNDGGGLTTAQKRQNTSDGIIFKSNSSSSTFSAYASRPGINLSCSTGDTGGGCSPGANVTYTANNLTSVNIGDARINGILFNHMKITTCSAGGGGVC
ncbi:hypothetical protein [Alcanivorax sp. MD8A]|uniref:hypothetical protein n=1 Tax=Alcanivorax sp. MD8A TaxID=1177157 RepID=UPI0011AF9E84|nr:hypothetical protein [Alcanivorax sp. MD8A]